MYTNCCGYQGLMWMSGHPLIVGLGAAIVGEVLERPLLDCCYLERSPIRAYLSFYCQELQNIMLTG